MNRPVLNWPCDEPSTWWNDRVISTGDEPTGHRKHLLQITFFWTALKLDSAWDHAVNRPIGLIEISYSTFTNVLFLTRFVSRMSEHWSRPGRGILSCVHTRYTLLQIKLSTQRASTHSETEDIWETKPCICSLTIIEPWVLVRYNPSLRYWLQTSPDLLSIPDFSFFHNFPFRSFLSLVFVSSMKIVPSHFHSF